METPEITESQTDVNEPVATEAPPQEKPKRISKLEPRECANPACGKQFIPFTKAAEYCSNTCRAQASKIRQGQKYSNGMSGHGIQPEFVKAEVPVEDKAVSILSSNKGDMGTQFALMMIDHQKNEAKRWEKKYDEEVADHKATKTKLEDLKDQVRQSDKPSALQGFLGAEGGSKLIEIFGPVIAGVMQQKMQSQPGVQMQGADQPSFDSQFGQWVSNLPEETQRQVLTLVGQMMRIDDPERLNYVIRGTLQEWSQKF